MTAQRICRIMILTAAVTMPSPAQAQTQPHAPVGLPSGSAFSSQHGSVSWGNTAYTPPVDDPYASLKAEKAETWSDHMSWSSMAPATFSGGSPTEVNPSQYGEPLTGYVAPEAYAPSTNTAVTSQIGFGVPTQPRH